MIESSFEKLLVLLVRNKVDFVTVGGVAVCLNGYIRLTEGGTANRNAMEMALRQFFEFSEFENREPKRFARGVAETRR